MQNSLEVLTNLRVKISPNSPKKAVQIVESIRDGKKVKQRIIRHVGTALTEDELTRLKDLATFIMANRKHEIEPRNFPPEQRTQIAIDARKRAKNDEELPVNLKKLREQQRIVLGIQEVMDRYTTS
jgi:hypothetical protein